MDVFERLEAICNDYDFLLCTMNDLNTDDKAQKMLNSLDYTKTTDTDIIIPYTLKIQQGLV